MIIQIDTDNPRDLRALQIVAMAQWRKELTGAFTMPASSGKQTYTVTPDFCTCPDAHDGGNVCKHRRAARLIEAHLAALVAAS